MERMSPADATFLYMENETDLYYNAWLGIFEGPPLSTEDFRAHIASKLPRLPRYRQRIRFVPHNIAAPVWVDDTHFHLPYHVRHVALPAPGTQEQLRELFTTVLSHPLDLSKPPWEMWLVDGLEGGRWGLISRLHHCMADGVSTTDITTTIMDADPDTVVEEVVDDWVPERSPTDAELVEAATAEQQRSVVEQVSRYTHLVGSLQDRITEMDEAFSSLSGSLSEPLSITSLNGPIGPYRRWEWVVAELSDIATVRKALGGTVNDVVLACVTRGFRDLLLARGEDIAGRTVRCQVPVSVRGLEDEEGSGGNRISCMFAELPVGVEDPVERLSQIREQLDGLKESQQALAADVLTSLAGFQPPALMAQSARMSAQAPNPVNTIVTNVPGPQHPLYILGRRMLDNYPFIPLASTTRIGTTVFSYDGRLRFGVSADYDSVPDLGVLVQGIDVGIRELIQAAQAAPPKRRPRRTGATKASATKTRPAKAARAKPAASGAEPTESIPSRAPTPRASTERKKS